MKNILPEFRPSVLLICVILCSIGIYSCQQESKSSSTVPIQPTLKADITAWDDLLMDLPEQDLLLAYAQEAGEHAGFKSVFEQIIGVTSDSGRMEELSLIRSDSGYVQLRSEVQQELGDLADVEPQINQTLENYLDVFGINEAMLPDVYTFISGFAYQVFLFDNDGKTGIGLGLDMFLGEDFPYQRIHPSNPSFSQYLVRTYNKEHIGRKIAEVLVEEQLIPPSNPNFLNLMIWGGKKLYLIDQILNFAPDTIVMEYSEEQLEWCNKNEPLIWRHFFEKDLFYETDLRKFNKLIAPAPTSPDMPPESPGQTGNFIGWQIVSAYMDRYPETSVAELIAMQDAQQLLDLSRYRPER